MRYSSRSSTALVFHRRLVRLLPITVLILSSAIAAACADSVPTEPHGGTVGPSFPSFSVSDDQLNYNDTWVSATQTIAETTFVQSDEPFLDPATNQYTTSMTLGSPPHQVPVLAGYGYDGQLRVTTGYAGSAPDEIVTVRQVNDLTSDVDGAGVSTSGNLSQEPAYELGTLVDAQIDVRAGSGGMSCSGTDACLITPYNRLGESSTPDAIVPSVTQIAPDRVRLTAVFSEQAIAEASEVLRSSGQVPAGLGAAVRGVRLIRDYRRAGPEWILERVRSEARMEHAGGVISQVQVATFNDVRSHRNPVEDAKRRARREGRGAGAATSPVAFAASRFGTQCDDEVAIESCSDDSSGGNDGTWQEPRVDELALIQSDLTTSPRLGDVTLVLQHGFISTSETWRPMHTWLGEDVRVGHITRKSLAWEQAYETQAAQLHQRLATDNEPGPTILIGHSNGGMVSRYLGRNPGASGGYQPLNIRGVVTLGTPHKGAPLARLGSARSVQLMVGWGAYTARIVCAWLHMAGCTRFGQLAGSPVSQVVGAVAGNAPVLAQTQPNSSYHASFNSQPEPFQRYGVQSYLSWKKWYLWQANGDLRCYEGESCGGRAEAKRTDRIYKRDLACSVVGFFVGRWDKAVRCALDAVFLAGIDRLTTVYFALGGDYTDGIVPRSSQLYPNIPMSDQYEIYGGPSHFAETKSAKVRVELRRVLTDRLGVAPQFGG